MRRERGRAASVVSRGVLARSRVTEEVLGEVMGVLDRLEELVVLAGGNCRREVLVRVTGADQVDLEKARELVRGLLDEVCAQQCKYSVK
jgi:hypothetical protein